MTHTLADPIGDEYTIRLLAEGWRSPADVQLIRAALEAANLHLAEVVAEVVGLGRQLAQARNDAAVAMADRDEAQRVASLIQSRLGPAVALHIRYAARSRAERDAAIAERDAARAQLAAGHYWSSACYHANLTGDPAEAQRLHAYCQADTGKSGTKTPARCKHYGEPCRCPCHGGER